MPSNPFQHLTLLDCTPGVQFLTTSFASGPGFDLTSQNLVSVEVGQFFGSTVIIRTASQAGDSFQPWLTSAFDLLALSGPRPCVLFAMENLTT